MCDQYWGDCLGRATYYWSEFWNYYGHSKNIANWMHVVVNQGNTPDKCMFDNYNASSFTDLFNQVNYEGLNEIWLYAQDIGDEDAINLFCQAAAEEGWLLREWEEYAIEYKCDGSCPLYCVWPTTGNWYVYRIWYTGRVQYLPY
jgi:hypothetical protein